MLMLTAHGLFNKMSPLSKNDLQRIFEKLDKNGDGLVSLDELNWLLERIGVQFRLEELESLVGKSCLGFDEFVFFYDSISNQNGGNDDDDEMIIDGDDEDGESDIAKAFKVFDLNGDGFISSEELQSVLARLGLWDERSGTDCRNMICYYDANLDGVIDFEEFKSMMFHTVS
ncbi:S-adenosyl-L-methionine-dependent methyltransferases superfamily protein [Hibiscus syriacus]|uniref:S-adenosyl-L-methionine-dependent methyltransferases superfamily protein n=1 Tax=Hibiscus syriacus TaxID=106335 RepID=A0A6A3CS08_HIBSY|nr:probable calcium-binding protein CML44 [Hibiscus syriacus]KAE8731234.1 S-adenosyl-L-methionine-dependent methyltransferases superfamily protein [Hibiscus syriacus]